MAFTTPIVTTAAGSTDDNSVATSGINTSGANLLIVCVSSYGTALGLNTLSDSVNGGAGNTWSALSSHNAGNVQPLSKLYYCAGSLNVGANHVFSLSSVASSYPVILVQAWAGSDAAPFDAQNGTDTGSIGVTAIQTGTVTPAGAGELIVAGASMIASFSNISIDSSFTISNSITIDTHTIPGSMAYLVSGSAVSPIWSWTTSRKAACSIAAFKPATTGSSIFPRFVGDQSRYAGPGGMAG